MNKLENTCFLNEHIALNKITKRYALSFDLGGTNFKFALFDLQSKNALTEFIDYKTYEYVINSSLTSEENFEAQVRLNIKDFLASLNVDKNNVELVACSVGGPMYPGNDELLGDNKFELKDHYQFSKFVKSVFNNCHVVNLNDSRSAIFGEWFAYYRNASTKYQTIIGYTIGTHVGGCIIHNSNILAGDHNHAAEFGHGSIMNESILTDFCGLEGCMGAHSSAKGVESLLEQDVMLNYSPLRTLSVKLQRKLTMKDLCQYIEQTQNPYAKHFLKKTFKSFANSLSYLIYAFDPGLILVGGTPSIHKDVLYEAITSNLHNLLIANYRKELNLKFCHLRGHANVFGAYYYALQTLKLIEK